jgi:hypothetical protein
MFLLWLTGLPNTLGRLSEQHRRRGEGRRKPALRLAVEVLEDRCVPSAVSWINPSSGDWNTGSNWSGLIVPQAGDDVTINQPGNVVVTHSANVIDSIHKLTNSDTLNLTGGNLFVDTTVTNTGTITVAGGRQLAAGTYTQTDGLTQLQGGTLGALLPPEHTSPAFTGSNHVQVPSSASLNPTTQMTLEAWVNPSSLNGPLQGIAGSWDDVTGGRRTYFLWIQSDRFAFYVSHNGEDFPNVVSTTTVQTNQWYHVAGTFDGTTMRLYVNGILEAAAASPGPINTNSQPFYIGRVDGAGTSTFFSGQIADVRLWNVARSEADIQGSMNQELTGSETGLAGSWRLDSAPGGTIFDQTNQNNGTLGGPVLSFNPVQGGLVDIQGGTLSGTGTINGSLRNAGAVDLGPSVGSLVVRGNDTQTATGSLGIKVSSGQSDQINATGTAAVDGTLNVSLLNGFAPTAGQTFSFLGAASTSGQFASTNIPVADGVTAFQVSTTATSVNLVGATVPPTSTVSALPTYSSPTFTVSWSGHDNPGGSGIASFDVYVSDNAGPFVPFLTGTTATSATFNGQRGHSYGFYSIATDNVGNREATPSGAEASTTVPTQVSTSTTLTTSAASGSTYGQGVTFTATVAANVAVFGTPTGSVQFSVDGVNFGAAVTLAGGSASLTTSALSAGQHTITAAYTSDTSDFGFSSATLSQSVAPAVLTVTADDQSKLYGAALPAFTATYSGFVNGDPAAVLSGAPSFTTQATASSNVGTYTITAAQGTLAATNYTFSFVNGTLTINKATLSVTADNQSRVYGAANPTLTATITGFVNGETLATSGVTGSPSLGTAATTSSPVGTYDITSSLGSLAASNYTFAFVNGTFTVNKASSSTTLTSSAPSGLAGQAVTFTATIAVVAPGAGTPTGTVTFRDGNTVLDTKTVVAGSASFTTSTLATGDHTITATYNGDGNFLSSSGSTPLSVVASSSLSGLVFKDFNHDGQVDFGEHGIAGVTISLTGTDDLNNSVSLSQATDSEGTYLFANLRPGTYTIHETQPANYGQGIDSVGSAGGSLTATDQFLVQLGSGVNGINYNFGELPPAGSPVHEGQLAGIGFWHNHHGQDLILALNDGGSSTQLGNWLAATLPNIFGVHAGSHNLTGRNNAAVAALFQTFFGHPGRKLDAEMMATALSVYVTNATLDPTQVAAQYGFTVSGDGAGTATFNVGSNGNAFGVANNTTTTVMNLLLATNDQAVNNILYNGNSTLRHQARNVYSALLEADDD